MPQEEQQEQPKLPELELPVVIQIMKDYYGVFIEPVEKKPYYVRFKQLRSGKTVQGMTHAKGTKISPRFLEQILDRFLVEQADFLANLAGIPKGPQRVE